MGLKENNSAIERYSDLILCPHSPSIKMLLAVSIHIKICAWESTVSYLAVHSILLHLHIRECVLKSMRQEIDRPKAQMAANWAFLGLIEVKCQVRKLLVAWETWIMDVTPAQMAPSPLAEMEGMVKHLTHWGNKQIHDPFFCRYSEIIIWSVCGSNIRMPSLFSTWGGKKTGRSEWNELHVKYGSIFEPVVWDNIYWQNLVPLLYQGQMHLKQLVF